MKRDLITSVIAVLVFTVLLGLAYPLATTGVAQVLFPNKADGSQVEVDGKVVGSRVIGQDFEGARATSSRVRRPPATTPPAPSSTTSGRTTPSCATCSPTP